MKTWRDIEAQQLKLLGFSFNYAEVLDACVARLPNFPVVVELGAGLGCSATYLVQRHNIDVYTVDRFHYNHSFFTLSNLKACGVLNRIRMLPCISWYAAKLFDNASVDFVWMGAGGAGEYDSVTCDLNAWKPKLKPEGVMAGHDLALPAVRRALMNFGPWKELGRNSWVLT